MKKDPWYKNKTLLFKCTGCGSCCTGFEGYVWLSNEEIEKIFTFLKISKSEFLKKCTRFVRGRISLKENLINYDCVFFKNKKCTIYSARPKQCKTFPFWEENLKSEKAFNDLNNYCPGVNHPSGKKYSYEEIKNILES